MIPSINCEPGQIIVTGINKRFIIWCGPVYEHLFCILSDGTTFRLDRDEYGKRNWTEVAKIPLEIKEDEPTKEG